VAAIQPPSGHVFRVERARGPVWHAKYRLPDGRQVQKKIGPASSERGRFSEAAEEWLRFIREDRERKPSTLVDYQSALRAHLLPAFGDRELESITPEEIELWRRSLKGLSNRSKNKLLIQLHGIFRRARSSSSEDRSPGSARYLTVARPRHAGVVPLSPKADAVVARMSLMGIASSGANEMAEAIVREMQASRAVGSPLTAARETRPDVKDVMSSPSAPACRDLLGSSAERVRAGLVTVELGEAPCEHRHGA
jgi:hypothetical protein